ncbi:alpha/beta fold hydrolase [Lysobacter sp. cf310]|uniref:alpha/beta fold hydrolase n=1 Tax=Lysobacter sp. cf310 TaxID=1761790 RepID=UPI0008EDB7F3|nr:alpha/beta fold hydrolase [Lysobacter sp. cf310]SFK66213.1 Alpha/beta hydrolase family protein [Lysobacter sp. cf310]
MSVPTTVLLHGAGVGAWVWDLVIERMAVPAIALDIPCRHPDATPERCARALIAELDRRGLDEVAIVAHSLAGVLMPDLAAGLGPRLRHGVYLAAALPPPGGAYVDALGAVERALLRLLFRYNRDGLTPGPAMIRKELCNDLDEASAAEVVARYEAEFPGLYLTPTCVQPVPAPSTYLRLLRDRSLVPARQDAMIARLPQARVRDLDAGHLAMLSAPAQVAELLTGIALDCALARVAA